MKISTGTIAMLALGGFAVWYLSQAGAGLNAIQVSLDSVSIQSATDLLVKLKFQNVSSVSGTIKAVTGDIYLNGNNIANLNGFQPTTIPAAGQVILPVNVDLNLLGLPGTVEDLASNGINQLNFEVKGNVNVDNIVVPFDTTQTFTV